MTTTRLPVLVCIVVVPVGRQAVISYTNVYKGGDAVKKPLGFVSPRNDVARSVGNAPCGVP
jgi:hypothetical protein